MNNFRNRLLSVLCAAVMLVPMIPQLHKEVQASFEEIPSLTLEKCKKAEISLREVVKGNGMELIDGGDTEVGKETYNACTTYNGEVGREVNVSNKLNLKFSEDFATPDDNLFLFAFRYWDYGGGGLFYLDYSSMDGEGLTSRVNVSKRGLSAEGTKTEGAWRWEYVIVAGARFTRSLDTGADFKIANRAANCFSDIVVYNLTPVAEELALIELGTFASAKATILFNFGLTDFETDAQAQALLGNKLTREVAISYTIDCLGLSKRAEEANLTCQYKDVASEYRKNIAYAKSIGLINNGTDTLGAQEIVKERELLEYYFKYLGLPTDGDIIKTAQLNNIIYGADCIFQPEKEALYDNLFAIGANILKVNAPGTNEMIVMDMLSQGIVTFAEVMKASDEAIMKKFLDEPFHLEPMEKYDPLTNRKYYALNFFGGSIMRPYMTQQTFSDDNETVVFCDRLGFIYVYNINTHIGKKIGEIALAYGAPSYVAMTFRNGTDELYYVSRELNIMRYDVREDTTTLIYDLPDEVAGASDVSITLDGRYFAFHGRLSLPGQDPLGTGFVCDIQEGELIIKPFYDFTESSGEGYYSQHAAINPVYTNVVTFASGGEYTGPGIFKSFQRMYKWDVETNEQGTFFDEYRTDIITGYGRYYGEQNGHESWTGNGEWLVVNKASSQYKGVQYVNGITGLLLVSPDGKERKYVGEAKFWNPILKEWKSATYTHPGADPIGERWVCSDDSSFSTFAPGTWPLIIKDTESSASYVPLTMTPAGPSDYHPHPAFSQNLQYVAFGLIDENGIGEIGWVDVSDITSLPQDGQRITLSESCETIDYHSLTEKFEYDLDIVEIDGETAYKIPFGRKMYVNAFNDVVWGRNLNVTLEIEYLDNGISPIKIDYIRWNGKGINQHLSQRYVTVPRTGKGGWQTATVTISDINMDNMEKLATDIKISGLTSDLVVRKVTAKLAEE